MKLLAQKTVGVASVNVYIVPTNRKATITSFVICNRGAVASNFRVAVVPKGQSISNEHYLYYDTALDANESFSMDTTLYLSSADTFLVSSTIGSLSVSAFGDETQLS